MASINRNSFKPIYYQLGEELRALIESNLAPGDQIPSENELISQYRVSRNTVRLAIESLIKDGLVYRVHGKGTFVAPERMRYGLLKLTSFTEEMQRRGIKPGSRILNVAAEVPPTKVASRLRLPPGALAVVIERLRLANDEPLGLQISYVPHSLCPSLADEDLARKSLYDLLENHYGLRIGHAEQVLKPTVANDYESELLEVPVGSPLLLVEGTTFLVMGEPVEYAKLLYRGDRYEFSIQATRHGHVGGMAI